MKCLTCLIVPLLLSASTTFADAIAPADRKTAQALVQALLADDRPAVSKLIRYPLRRESPIPEIANAHEFIQHYDEFFDAKSIAAISDGLKDMGEISGSTMLGDRGEIWIQNGSVITINSQTSKRADAMIESKRADAAKLNAAAANYDKLLFECKTKSFHIRVQQEPPAVIRYYSWKSEQPTSEPPVLALTGSSENQGSQGGTVYTFKKGAYTYTVEALELCKKVCKKIEVTRDDKLILDQPCL